MTEPFKSLVTTFFAAALGLAVAAGIGIEGQLKISGAVPSNLRVAVFANDKNGKPIQELSSAAPTGNAFKLELPSATPSTPSYALNANALDWPGLVGKANIEGNAKVVRATVAAYSDNDNSKSFSAGDKLFEGFVTRGRGGVVMIWSETKFSVRADKGFVANLEPGWNVLQIEIGKTLEVNRVEAVGGLMVEVFVK